MIIEAMLGSIEERQAREGVEKVTRKKNAKRSRMLPRQATLLEFQDENKICS
jgi:hypothetical protein